MKEKSNESKKKTTANIKAISCGPYKHYLENGKVKLCYILDKKNECF